MESVWNINIKYIDTLIHSKYFTVLSIFISSSHDKILNYPVSNSSCSSIHVVYMFLIAVFFKIQSTCST